MEEPSKKDFLKWVAKKEITQKDLDAMMKFLLTLYHRIKYL